MLSQMFYRININPTPSSSRLADKSASTVGTVALRVGKRRSINFKMCMVNLRLTHPLYSDPFVMFNSWERIIEVMQKFFPLLIFLRAAEPNRVRFQCFPVHQQDKTVL